MGSMLVLMGNFTEITHQKKKQKKSLLHSSKVGNIKLPSIIIEENNKTKEPHLHTALLSSCYVYGAILIVLMLSLFLLSNETNFYFI
jgi:hypothetical protein